MAEVGTCLVLWLARPCLLLLLLKVGQSDRVTTFQSLGGHQRVAMLLLVLVEGRAWEVIHANVSLNCVVLLKAGISRLHQTL